VAAAPFFELGSGRQLDSQLHGPLFASCKTPPPALGRPCERRIASRAMFPALFFFSLFSHHGAGKQEPGSGVSFNARKTRRAHAGPDRACGTALAWVRLGPGGYAGLPRYKQAKSTSPGDQWWPVRRSTEQMYRHEGSTWRCMNGKRGRSRGALWTNWASARFECSWR